MDITLDFIGACLLLFGFSGLAMLAITGIHATIERLKQQEQAEKVLTEHMNHLIQH